MITIKKTSVEAVKSFADGILDFVFIDGDHNYETVKQDIILWPPKLKGGGILCGDDYGKEHIPGVKRAVDELLPQRKLTKSGTIWWVNL